jgi:hypothetical protein
MKLIIEGTEEQMNNLKELLASDINLPKFNTNYYTDNLWHIADVQSKFECTNEGAMDILNKVMTNSAVIEYIMDAILIYSK